MTQLRPGNDTAPTALCTLRLSKDPPLLCPCQATDTGSRAVQGTQPDAPMGWRAHDAGWGQPRESQRPPLSLHYPPPTPASPLFKRLFTAVFGLGLDMLTLRSVHRGLERTVHTCWDRRAGGGELSEAKGRRRPPARWVSPGAPPRQILPVDPPKRGHSCLVTTPHLCPCLLHRAVYQASEPQGHLESHSGLLELTLRAGYAFLSEKGDCAWPGAIFPTCHKDEGGSGRKNWNGHIH